jgi:hypothetical protein
MMKTTIGDDEVKRGFFYQLVLCSYEFTVPIKARGIGNQSPVDIITTIPQS